MNPSLPGSIVITLDSFFFLQKEWKEEVFSIPAQYLEISWSGRRTIYVFKYTKMNNAQFLGSNNCPRFTPLDVVHLTDFNIF